MQQSSATIHVKQAKNKAAKTSFTLPYPLSGDALERDMPRTA